jgi:hypothetical protein
MPELNIPNINLFENSSNECSYILIQNTNQIPPHISLVVEGNYFSVSVSGVKTEVDFQSVLKNIQLKNIPCLILEISKIKFSSNAIADIFNHYGRLDKPEKSCLFPILDVLNRAYGLILESEFVFELITELKKCEKLLAVFHLNMENLLKGNDYLFPIYNRKDISFCIDKLNIKQSA